MASVYTILKGHDPRIQKVRDRNASRRPEGQEHGTLSLQKTILTLRAFDPAGNEGAKPTRVMVPHDRGQGWSSTMRAWPQV
jgi:hypothetical protein